MDSTTSASILQTFLSNSDNYVCVALFVVLLVRQVRFEQYCHTQFALIQQQFKIIEERFQAIEKQLEGIKSTITDMQNTLKEMDFRFRINDFKHETYEEKFRRLEAERSEASKSKPA
jgi:hypothetical protein